MPAEVTKITPAADISSPAVSIEFDLDDVAKCLSYTVPESKPYASACTPVLLESYPVKLPSVPLKL